MTRTSHISNQNIKILSRSVIHSTLFSCREFGESGEFDDFGEPSDSGESDEFGDSGESSDFGDLFK